MWIIMTSKIQQTILLCQEYIRGLSLHPIPVNSLLLMTDKLANIRSCIKHKLLGRANEQTYLKHVVRKLRTKDKLVPVRFWMSPVFRAQLYFKITEMER